MDAPMKQIDVPTRHADPGHPDMDGVVHSFVPRWFAAAPQSLGARPLAPAIASLPCAAAFADISGFSQLTRRYADRGADGIETLTHIIDDFLGRLLDTVARWRGDVEDLYGDGMLAFWPAEPGADLPVAQALGCAAELVARFDGFEAAPGVTLRLRAAVVAGDCFGLQLGGVSEHWLFVLAGNCLTEFGALLDAAGPGQVALGMGIVPLLPSGARLMSAANLIAALRELDFAPFVPTPQPACLEPEVARLFLSRPLRYRRLHTADGAAEFRAVTILCTGFPALRCDGPEHLDELQQIVATVQRIMHDHDGAVIRCSMNEKGPMLLSAFGVPDCTHADDPSRALLVALDLVRATAGARCTVASGTAFCGVVGNAVRRAFTPNGEAVNRAAKLLTVAALPAIVCDQATARAADRRLQLRPLGEPVEIGRERPTLFEPVAAASSAAAMRAVTVIGRDREIATLRQRIDALTGTGSEAGVVTIEGEAGIGKSVLVEHLLHRLRPDVRVLRADADPMTSAAPLGALSPLFARLFAADAASGPDAVLRAVAAALKRRDINPAHASLAGAVLPLALGSEPSTPARELSPEDAAWLQGEVLLALLHDRVGDRSAIILIEDAHWLDSASWLLLNRAARDFRDLILLFTARPPTDVPWQGFEAMLDVRPIEHIRLSPLSEADTGAMLADNLGCTQIEQRVLAAITERSRRSPLFAVQLALGLRERGVLAIEHGICFLDPSARDDVLQELPDTLQRTIVARFDRLPEPLQLTLKGASAFGRPFSASALRVLAPTAGSQHELQAALGDLIRSGMLRSVAGTGAEPGAYDFAQPVAREAIYGLLPFAQRRALHESVARYLETASEGTRPADAVLGFHWAQAGDPERAMGYWERADSAALEAGAYREAGRAYGEAVQAVERLGERAPPPDRIAMLRQNFGEALLHTGDLPRSRAELRSALGLLGRPFGRGVASAIATLGQGSALLAWSEVRGRREMSATAEPRNARFGRLARIYENLGQVLGHSGEIVGMAACVVAALNAARKGGDDAVYSRSAGLLALACLLIAWPRGAERYYAHACRTRPGTDRPHDRLMTSEYIAMYLLAAARLAEAETELRVMISLAAESGNQRRGLDAASLLTLCLFEAGRAGDCALPQAMLAETANQYGDPQLRCWLALEQAQLEFAAGAHEAVARHLAFAERLLPHLGFHEAVWTFGLFAALRSAQDRGGEALDYARRATGLAARQKIAVYAQHGVFGAAAASLRALEQAGCRAAGELAAEARQTMRTVARYSLRMPVTRPRGLFLLAHHARLSGRRRRAERLLARAEAEAAMQGRPYGLAVAFPWSITDRPHR